MRDIFVAELSKYNGLLDTYQTKTVDHAATGVWMGLLVSYRLLRGTQCNCFFRIFRLTRTLSLIVALSGQIWRCTSQYAILNFRGGTRLAICGVEALNIDYRAMLVVCQCFNGIFVYLPTREDNSTTKSKRFWFSMQNCPRELLNSTPPLKFGTLSARWEARLQVQLFEATIRRFTCTLV